jgi:uncharacterized membrane protein YhfC
MKSLQNILLALTLLLSIGLITACSPQTTQQTPLNQASFSLDEPAAGEKMLLAVSVDQAFLDAGQKIPVESSGKLTKGLLHIEVRDPQGTVVWDPGQFGGEYSVNSFVKPTTPGEYQLWGTWKEPVMGEIKVFSTSQSAVPLGVLVPGMGMILVAIGFVVYSLRNGGTWRYIGLGGLAWVIAVAIKFAIAIPINPIVFRALGVYEQTNLGAFTNIIAYIYVGLLTGLTEVLLMWLFIRYTRFGQVSWGKALAFGVGVGALEAFLLGLVSLLQSTVAILTPGSLPPSSLAILLQTGNFVYGFGPISERIFTTLCHILACVLMFYAVNKKQARWLWVSFVFMSVLDTVGAFGQFWGVETVSKLWTIEAAIVAFGLIAWWGSRRIKKDYQNAEA